MSTDTAHTMQLTRAERQRWKMRGKNTLNEQIEQIKCAKTRLANQLQPYDFLKESADEKLASSFEVKMQTQHKMVNNYRCDCEIQFNLLHLR